MHKIIDILDNINASSERILHELNADEPVLEKISEEMKIREQEIEHLKLMDITEQVRNMGEIKERLAVFSRLQSAIQTKVSRLMNAQKETLAHATKQRKVEDMYKKSYHKY